MATAKFDASAIAAADARPPPDPALAAEAFRSTIEAFGPEKLARIRAQIRSIPIAAQLPPRTRPSISLPTIPSSSATPPGPTHLLPIAPPKRKQSSTPPPPPPPPPVEEPADEDDVSRTIALLEIALGKEDMADLCAAMQSVRRKSMVDVLISSEMSPAELAANIELVKTRQEHVLTLLFNEIMELVDAKLGIIEARDPGSRRWKDWKWEEEWGGSNASGSTVVGEGSGRFQDGMVSPAQKPRNRKERGGLDGIVAGPDAASGSGSEEKKETATGESTPTTPIKVDAENMLKVPSPEELASRKKKAAEAARNGGAAANGGVKSRSEGSVRVTYAKGGLKKERKWRACMCVVM